MANEDKKDFNAMLQDNKRYAKVSDNHGCKEH